MATVLTEEQKMSKVESFVAGSASYQIIDGSDDLMHELQIKIDGALEDIGQQAEGHAKTYLESSPERVDTGRLRNSITHTYSHKAGFSHSYKDKAGNSYSQDIGTGESVRTVFIGTNVEYAVYVHEGTGEYATGGTGAKNIPWRYQDAKGNWYTTRGMKPNRFLKNAIQNHTAEYKEIARRHLGGK